MSVAQGRIPVVDDDASLRSVVAEALRFEGYTVDEAGNCLEGLDRLRAGALPGLVVLDLRMPVLDGVGFLVRAQVRLCGIPIVIVSATPELPKGTTALGVKALLPKPFELALLLAVVDRLVWVSGDGISRPAHRSTGAECG